MLAKIMVPGIYYDNFVFHPNTCQFSEFVFAHYILLCVIIFLIFTYMLTAFKQFGDHFIDGEVLSDSGTF